MEEEFFSAEDSIFKNFLVLQKTLWESLSQLENYIESLFKNPPAGLIVKDNLLLAQNVSLGKDVTVIGKSVLLAGSEVMSNAILRDGIILGENSFIGFGIEIKHSVIMNNSRIPHLNYVADSIIGSNVNFGAGAITANWKGGFDNKDIFVRVGTEKINTQLEKFGAVVADGVHLGANNVLAPGTIVGKETVSYPLCFLRGEIPAHKIVKNKANLEIVDKE